MIHCNVATIQQAATVCCCNKVFWNCTELPLYCPVVDRGSTSNMTRAARTDYVLCLDQCRIIHICIMILERFISTPLPRGSTGRATESAKEFLDRVLRRHARASYKWEKRRREDDKGTWCIKMSVLWLFQPHCEQTNGAEWRKVLKLQMKALIISPLSHGCLQCVACVAPIRLRCQWPQPVFERFPVRETSVIKHFESQKLKVRLADMVEADPMSKPDEQPLFNATRETFIKSTVSEEGKVVWKLLGLCDIHSQYVSTLCDVPT